MRFPYQAVKNFFTGEPIRQLFERYCNGHATEQEQRTLEKWVRSVESLQPLYEDINYTIEWLRRLEGATPEVQKEILQLMKNRFPKQFGSMPDNVMPFLLPQIVKGNLSFFQWQLCKKIESKGRWIKVISLVVRVGIVALIVLIILEVCK
jgi:hypothetical protein